MSSFLQDDSPLFNPPGGLHPKQRVAVDGVRLAFEMLGESWQRLNGDLGVISVDREAPLMRPRLAMVYMHTWVIIDVLHRLRLLLIAMPGLKRVPHLEAAIRALAEVKPLRDGFQHVDEQLQDTVTAARPLWGAVSWVWSPPEMLNVKARLFTVVVGGIREGEFPISDPRGKHLSVPIGMITAHAFGHSVNLSTQVQRASGIAAYLDSALRNAPKGEGGMADILMSVDLVFGKAEDGSTDTA